MEGGQVEQDRDRVVMVEEQQEDLEAMVMLEQMVLVEEVEALEVVVVATIKEGLVVLGLLLFLT